MSEKKIWIQDIPSHKELIEEYKHTIEYVTNE
jgi:hypothetical protein